MKRKLLKALSLAVCCILLFAFAACSGGTPATSPADQTPASPSGQAPASSAGQTPADSAGAPSGEDAAVSGFSPPVPPVPEDTTGIVFAETVNYKDLMERGSYAAAKEAGLVRLEGKEYIVKDGDVILFRFNV